MAGELESSAAAFDAAFAAVDGGVTLGRIWREVYGADYPHDADPYSFVTLTDLHRMAGLLNIGPGQTLVDMACGRGGPGLWMARHTGASLVGVDFSRVAVAQAGRRAAELGLERRSRFAVADAAHTGLPAGEADAVMSIDAFWLFPDKPAAAAELARIMCPGGMLVFTTWDSDSALAGVPEQLAEHGALLEQAGFAVVAYEETPDWKRRQLDVYERLLAAESELTAELGAAAADFLVEAREVPAWLEHSRRVLIGARRR